MDRTAHLLPAPLFVIYSQLVAACEALHDPCTASIMGDVEAAGTASQAAITGE